MGTIVRGACPLDCPDTCSWLVEVEDGRAVGLRGDRSHPFTHGALCPKVNRYLDAVNGPGRVHPIRCAGSARRARARSRRSAGTRRSTRRAGGLRAAIDAHGPESVLPYYFAGTEGMVQGWIMGPRLFAALGASRLETTICTAAGRARREATYGGQVGIDPEALRVAQIVILWGANLLSTGMHIVELRLAAQRRGAHVVGIDPLRTDHGRALRRAPRPAPGTDAALALGLMRVSATRAGRLRVARALHRRLARVRGRLDEWPVERAAAICGLAGRRHRRARRAVRSHAADGDHASASGCSGTAAPVGGARDPRAAGLTGDFRHVGGGAPRA